MKEIPAVCGYITLGVWFASMLLAIIIAIAYTIYCYKRNCPYYGRCKHTCLSLQERERVYEVLKKYRQKLSVQEYIDLLHKVSKIRDTDVIVDIILAQTLNEMEHDGRKNNEADYDSMY